MLFTCGCRLALPDTSLLLLPSDPRAQVGDPSPLAKPDADVSRASRASLMPHSCDIPSLVGHTIDGGRLRFTDTIGSGSNGVIFLAEDTTTPAPHVEYAVKCVIRAERGTRRYGLQRQEIQFHRLLSGHPNVVTLHKVIEDRYYLFLVMDYCRGGDFFTYLSSRRTYRGDDEFVRSMFLQVLDALEACHEAGVYHRDIKPENFLVNEDGTRLFLTDFGLATANLYSRTYGAGSSLYMSPECIGAEMVRPAYNTRSNDIWALGVILTSMISGHNPWNNACRGDPCYRVYIKNNDFLREMLPISDSANRLLQQIFRREYMRHITLAQIRTAVEDMDTFFMRPAEIAAGNEYLRSAAKSYFGGSRHQAYFVPWSSSASPIATDAGEEDEDGDSDVGDGDSVQREGSPSSTLETSGPVTPELRAQQMQPEVDVPDDLAHAPYLSRPLYTPPRPAPPAPAVKKHQHLSTSTGFLRRFMDRFLVES
ncbi:transporter [Ganoderma sinense ZZ0214-1]|uniref:non-specific serine/threonine protein kinase n=1 Tax=Ganoderma sinense ZZ0214-1 TaxID=1077348 RepID=A0A2G8S1C9_9APHY|nr:transporter [Ganoderma sinense ZZ0214-1]